MEDRVYQLLATKGFKDLSPQERQDVLAVMSSKDYDNARVFLSRTEKVMENMQQGITPDPKLQHRLRTAFLATYGSPKKIDSPRLERKHTGFWSPRKLAYALAIGLVLMIVSSLLFRSPENDRISTTEMDIGTIENFAEMNQYMYLDTTCLDVAPMALPAME